LQKAARFAKLQTHSKELARHSNQLAVVGGKLQIHCKQLAVIFGKLQAQSKEYTGHGK
jgi:hypothetical protein